MSFAESEPELTVAGFGATGNGSGSLLGVPGIPGGGGRTFDQRMSSRFELTSFPKVPTIQERPIHGISFSVRRDLKIVVVCHR